MIPGFGGKMSPKKMERLMKQMGISMDELSDVKEVIIRTAYSEITIPHPSVTLMEVQGQKTYQVVGEAAEKPLAPEVSDEDIKLVAAQTKKSEEEAKAALEETGGDLAEAIMKLST